MEGNRYAGNRHRKVGRVRWGQIITPTGITFWAIVAAGISGDLILGVARFILGYSGFLTGSSTTPMTPYTDGMAILTFPAAFLALKRKGAPLIDSLAVALATVLASMSSFEFLWDYFQIAGVHYTAWIGFPGPEWHYVFAFNSITALWITGFRYWNFRWWSVILFISYPLSFIAWYLSGYPQPWSSSTPDAAYFWNAAVKVLSFIGPLAPLIAVRTFRPARNGFR